MGRFKWAWGRVRAGQVIWFRYGKTGRTIIVLSCPKDPGTKDRQKLHGIEITRGRRGKNWIRSRLPLICRFTGGVQLLIDDKNGGKYLKMNVGYAEGDNFKPKRAYTMLKQFLNKADLYRTYTWEDCKKSQIWLDNNEINEYNVPYDVLKVSGIFPSETKPKRMPKPRTFKVNPKRPRRQLGEVWQRPSGKWAGKNLDGLIKAFRNQIDAEVWANSTAKSKKRQLLKKADKRSKNPLDG